MHNVQVWEAIDVSQSKVYFNPNFSNNALLRVEVYTGVMRQTCHVVSEKGVSVVLPAVARQLMSTDGGVSWPKVVSLYAVAGGLALDCVLQGHPEFLQIIVESMCQAFEQDIALWIVDNGGWVTLFY